MVAIELTAVSKRFGRTVAVRSADLSIGDGERVVVSGPNGSGKSTLLRMICGLVRPDSGVVRLSGRSPTEARAQIGYVGHETLLYPSLTAAENLQLFATLYSSDRPVEEWLERFGLAGKRGQLVSTFSRGEAQRLALARATIHEPSLLILDEPFTGLDPETAAAVPGLILQEQTTAVIVTHDVDRANAIATRTLSMSGGTIA